MSTNMTTASSASNPLDEQSLVDTLGLAMVAGVGPLLRHALLERFGTSADVLAAAQSDLQSVCGSV